jgi:hypothetical protein
MRPHSAYVKAVLEQRHSLSRRRTPFEYVDIIITGAQWTLWGWRLALQTASDWLSTCCRVLSILGGMLSFTVVLAIAISFLSAAVALLSLLLSNVAGLLDKASTALDWARGGNESARSAVGGSLGYGLVGRRWAGGWLG